MAADYSQPYQSFSKSGGGQSPKPNHDSGQQVSSGGSDGNVTHGNGSSSNGKVPNGNPASPSSNGGEQNIGVVQVNSEQTMGALSLEDVRRMYPRHFDNLTRKL